MTRPTPQILAQRSAAAAAPGPGHPGRTVPAPAPGTATGAGSRAGSTRHTATTTVPATPMTGAQCLVRALEALHVEVVFGIPGTAIRPVYQPLLDSPVRHILVRHEQGAGHAATGYAQATGEIGVCLATSGPGATNLVTPIADAYMDSVGIVAITGQVARAAIGTDAFQEADIRGITLPITKHNYLVQSAEELPRVLAEAFHLAGTGRPGPVLVDIPKDVLQSMTTFSWPPVLDLPGYRPTVAPHGKQIGQAARLIAAARRPVLYVGGGVLRAGAAGHLRRLAELTGAPVVTTLTARGAFPDSHPQHLGMPGMHGSVAAVYALQRADLIVALGARFDDRVTGRPDTFAPEAAVVHADIDPAEIGKNRAVEVPIVGDAAYVIKELVTAAEGELTRAAGEGHPPARDQAGTGRAALAGWWATLTDLRQRFPLGWVEPADGSLPAQYVIKRLGELVGPQARYVAGVGRHQIWAARFIACEQPGSWLSSGGLGTMGYAIPAAMGAKVGRPDTVVWAIDGDSCFQMTNQELATCAIEGIPIKVALINNGAVSRLPGRESGRGDRRIPDFVQLAEALGCVGLRCESRGEVDAAIEAATAVTDVPVVIDFVVGQDDLAWPMVAAGTSVEEVRFAREIRPAFDEDDL